MEQRVHDQEGQHSLDVHLVADLPEVADRVQDCRTCARRAAVEPPIPGHQNQEPLLGRGRRYGGAICRVHVAAGAHKVHYHRYHGQTNQIYHRSPTSYTKRTRTP